MHVPGGLRVGQLEVGAVQRDLRQGDSGGHQENTGALSKWGQRLFRADENGTVLRQESMSRYELIADVSIEVIKNQMVE